MNETVVDTEEVMAVIEVVIFMILSQSMCLRNRKNDQTNEERYFFAFCMYSRSLHKVTKSLGNLLSRYEREGLNSWKER